MAQNNFIDAKQLVDKLTAAFYEHDKAISQSVTKLADLNKQYAKLPSDYTKSLKEIEKSQQQITKTSERLSKVEKEAQRNRIAEIRLAQQREKAFDKYDAQLKRSEKARKRAIAQAEKENSVYNRVNDKLRVMANEYRNLAIRKEIGVKLTTDEANRMAFLERRITTYDAALKKVDAQMGRHQRNVGNYKSGYDGLGFSIAQLTREAPAFANSMQTGFMAISNNIPMLVDEINKLKQANVELTASGKPTVSIFKQLARGLFSWQTLISVGVTLLTVYGAKLFEMAFGMSEAEKATEEANKAIEEQNNALRENIRIRKQQLQDVTDVINSTEIADQFKGLLTGSINESEKAGLALVELSERLDAAGVKNAETLKDQNILQSDRIRIGVNILEIEKQKVRLAEERLRLDDELKKKADILRQAKKGEINEQQKSIQLQKLGETGLETTLKIQGEINRLETVNNEIIGKTVELEKDRNKEKDSPKYLKDTVNYYAALIAKTAELRDNTAQTRSEYEKFDRVILNLTYHMQLLTGEWQEFLREMQKEPEFLSNDETEKQINANTSALEKENAELLKQAAIREKAARDAVFAEQQIEDAFVRLGNTLGIQEQTTRDLFDGIKNGFLDAGEAAEAFGALAVDALNALVSAQRNQMEQRIEQLENEKNVQIEFAGESATARAAIEERFARKIAAEKTKQAKREKTAAIIQSIISTAVAVVNTLASTPYPANLAFAAIIGALGAAQVAIIASQPIPQFEKGVRNFEGGTAMINEKRQEVVTTPDGGVHRPKGKNLLVNLPKGSDVYKSEADFQRSLNAQLENNGITYMPAPKEKGLTAMEVEIAMRRAIGAGGDNVLTIDKNGFTSYIQKGMTRTNIMNNRVQFKGKKV